MNSARVTYRVVLERFISGACPKKLERQSVRQESVGRGVVSDDRHRTAGLGHDGWKRCKGKIVPEGERPLQGLIGGYIARFSKCASHLYFMHLYAEARGNLLDEVLL